MKANQKFIRADEGVSPVIAVILMVAITVVLAATVYVWVSGFGASGSQAKTLAASGSSSGLVTIASVAPNFAWSTLKITVEGAASGYGIYANGKYVRDAAWTDTAATGTLAAGNAIKVAHRTAGVAAITVNFVDTAANAVVASVSVPVAADTTAPTVSPSATKADPTVVTWSEATYTTSTFTAPNTLFVFTDVSGDSDVLGSTALSYSQGMTSIGVDMDDTAGAPDATDTIGPHATNKVYDLAGNAWASTYTYT